MDEPGAEQVDVARVLAVVDGGKVAFPKGFQHAPGVVAVMLEAAEIQVVGIVQHRVVQRHALGEREIQPHDVTTLVNGVIGVVRHPAVYFVHQRRADRPLDTL